MPRQVDRDERRREICLAAIKLLAERGPAGLTLRELARELGGSITLVTHFYPNRSALLDGIVDQAIADYDSDLAVLETDLEPTARLRVLLEWMLPLDEISRREEVARVMLLGGKGTDLPVQRFFDAMESMMRGLLRDHLAPLIPADQVESTAEALRVFTSGIVLSAAEHPDDWPRTRQLALLDRVLTAFGLDDIAHTPPHEARLVRRRADALQPSA
jgi:AcrR family transcriptional regulator